MTTNPRFARPLWHLVDAKGQIVGRLATQLSGILRGKHKPTFMPNADCGDYVVVINAAEVKFTGNKDKDSGGLTSLGYEFSKAHLRLGHLFANNQVREQMTLPMLGDPPSPEALASPVWAEYPYSRACGPDCSLGYSAQTGLALR